MSHDRTRINVLTSAFLLLLSPPQQCREEQKRAPFQTHLILSKEETNAITVHYDPDGTKGPRGTLVFGRLAPGN